MMITYIQEISFHDAIFRIVLKLRHISEEVMDSISHHVKRLRQDLQRLEVKFSKDRQISHVLKSFYNHLFIRTLQNDFSELVGHQDVVRITYREM